MPVRGVCLAPLSPSAGGGSENLLFTYDSKSQVLTIRKPGTNVAEDFTITIYLS